MKKKDKKPEEQQDDRFDIAKIAVNNMVAMNSIVHSMFSTPKSTNDLKKLPDILPQQPKGIMTWEQAKVQMDEGKCVRSVEWPVEQFMWLNRGRAKEITEETNLYNPINKEFLKARGVQRLIIGKHTNMWTGKSIWVGYHPSKEDKQGEWVEYEV